MDMTTTFLCDVHGEFQATQEVLYCPEPCPECGNLCHEVEYYEDDEPFRDDPNDDFFLDGGLDG